MKSPDKKLFKPEKESPKFKEGDKVRLTEEKVAQLKKGGFMEGFPSIEGEVSTVSGKMMSVQFGHAVRMVEDCDVEKVE
ncbi:MAG: hypothetical protein MUC28_00225 [Planctomycetes bacterium]|jgi:hypothetical protein|nr:hypothetical protein [Planctomycetota bacterium]